MNSLQMLQALATLRPGFHMMKLADAHDINLWLDLAGDKMDMRNLSEKTLQNVDRLYRKYFEA